MAQEKTKQTRQKSIKRKITGDQTQMKQSKRPNLNKAKQQESDSESDSDTECLYCADLYSTSMEGWIRCSRCLKWALPLTVINTLDVEEVAEDDDFTTHTLERLSSAATCLVASVEYTHGQQK
ncbi:hypothetical protein MML48_8g00015500 [Holotrichia oblita]|uniref:Uncharacterized protein n=1 Tax=Holotrichia oblita TaxID=644536 RepID=A0ACB9SPR7_HOLOL|nr:hypothetical protein MML48_8g00015500 [Holotrichia oblita]